MDADSMAPRGRRLQPLYYLHNFRIALATLKERYIDLLSSGEADFIARFGHLSESAQCLVTRLVMRKGPLFRRATLHYTEIVDFEEGMQELVALGWLDPDPAVSAEELFGVLNSQELRLAVGTSRARMPRPRPIGNQETQLALPLLAHPTLRRTPANWSVYLTGCLVRLCIEPIVMRLQLLFFGNHHQTWAEFVLADLGVKRYESVAIDANARAFQSREEIAHFYRLNECRVRLDAGEAAAAVRESALLPPDVCGWLHSRFLQLQLRIGERLEAEGDVESALLTYRHSGTVEGLVRAVRIQVRLGFAEAAMRDAQVAREIACSEAHHEAIGRALAPVNGRRGRGSSARQIDEGTEIIALRLPKPGKRQRIERLVVAHLNRAGSALFYVENSLISSLFGLLCWEALFAPVQGAFFHPFQSGPADLHTTEFRPRRAAQFHALLGLLDTGQHEAIIWRLYREKAGIRTNFVRWGRLRPRLLALALQCIPPSHLKLSFERLLEDLKDHASGLPDLIQFWPAERRYRLIEVKGPGDRLKDNQRRWLKFFAAHQIPAAVCHVQWQLPE